MAFNPNIQNNKKIADSPFLTLSQRNKEGISSENIYGTQATKAAEGKNIFGQDEAQGVKGEQMFAQEEKGAEEYIQEDEQGNVAFDEQGFYDDAWGISLSTQNQNTTNPIKAGSSNQTGDTKEAEEKLAKLVKDGKTKTESQLKNI